MELPVDMPMDMSGNLAAQLSSALGKDAKKLVKLFKDLGTEDKQTLLSFAEFLQGRDPSQTAEPTDERLAEPEYEVGPEGESVIKAIKRLGRVYYMVDKSLLLNDTSSLMTRHLMQGAPAQEIIVELEILFKTTYQSIAAGDEQKKDAE